MPGVKKLDRTSRRVVQHDLRAASEALGQIQTRDRELVEAQGQQTALGAGPGTPALNGGAGASGTSSAFIREREFGLSDGTAGDGASGVTYTAFPTAPWYRALAFALVADYTRGVPGGARTGYRSDGEGRNGNFSARSLAGEAPRRRPHHPHRARRAVRIAAERGGDGGPDGGRRRAALTSAAAAGAHACGGSVRACAVGNPWRRQERSLHADLQWFEVQAKGASGSRIRDRRAGCIQELQRCRRARPSAGAAGVAHSGSHSVPRRGPSLPAVRRGDAEGYRGWSGRSSAGRPASESRGQREAAAGRQHDLAR